jgi:CRISPR-associated protein Cas5
MRQSIAPCDFLDYEAENSVGALLRIEALAPLSMVAKLPGKYYTTQPRPTDHMLYAMLENALGWHIGPIERAQMIKLLEKRFGDKARSSGVGYQSLLQWHIRFGPVITPPLQQFDDLWTQHLKGKSFADGSRNYDSSAIRFMNAKRSGLVTTSDAAKARKGEGVLTDFKEGEEISITVLRPYFPQYYSSPTPRGYVEATDPYIVQLTTSVQIAEALRTAIEDPAAPLYLGSNDGWVDVTWHETDYLENSSSDSTHG